MYDLFLMFFPKERLKHMHFSAVYFLKNWIASIQVHAAKNTKLI